MHCCVWPACLPASTQSPGVAPGPCLCPGADTWWGSVGGDQPEHGAVCTYRAGPAVSEVRAVRSGCATPVFEAGPPSRPGRSPALKTPGAGRGRDSSAPPAGCTRPLPGPCVSPRNLHSFESVKENSDHFPKTTHFTSAEPTCSPSPLPALQDVPRSLSLWRLLTSCTPEAAAWGCAVHPDPLQLAAQPLCL